MSTKWVKDCLYFHELRQILKHKYAKTRFDLIISSDNDAFDFLRDYRDDVFGRIPVVFNGVNYFKESDLAGKVLFTGVSETADLQESLELALRLHPSVKRIFVINDFGISGRKVRDEIAKLAPIFHGRVRIEYENSTDLETILKDVESLSPDTLIFYTFFYGDPARTSYENSDCISLISRHSRVPVYGAWDFNLGYGIVGGKLTNGYDQGITSGRMGLRILKGERVDDIPAILKSQTRYMFNYRQMAHFGIKKSAIPKESIVINGPETFHKVPNELIWATLFGIASLSGVILMLLHVNRQRKRSEEALQKARDELEIVVGERTRDLSVLNKKLCEDIAERQKTEEALRNSRSLLNDIINSNPDLVAVIDADLRIVHSNWRGEYQNIPEELREKERLCYEVFCQGRNEPCDFCPVNEVFRTGKPVFLERYIAHKGYIEIRACPICDEAGNVIMVAEQMRDISERKKMEENIQKAQRLESIGVLAGSIAHDFNNLLTGIMGNISLAKVYVDPSEKAFDRLEEAEKACDLTKDLTRQLLTFAKGGAPIKKVDSMPRIIVDSAGFVLSGSNVKCEFFLPEDLWDVEVDGGQMSQVINNLIINANQAMPDGGIITVRAENVAIGPDTSLPLREGRYVHILIRDQGLGIPEENLAMIFDPYFTTKKKGSGLGLASVYSIIKKHDGHVGVESIAGKETTFHLYLPASEKDPVGESTLPEHRWLSRGKGRILVVDGEREVGQAAREILGHLGYQADACDDGMAALNL
jgi:signal transduction histidine kinase